MRKLFIIVALLLATSLAAWSRKEETLEELKARAESANVDEQAGICVRIAEQQLQVADKLFVEGKSEEARSALDDVVKYSEKARDAATKSGKKLKPTEIAVRKMAHKLRDVKHSVAFEDQPKVQEAIEHLERVRTDLLTKMFGRGEK
jgi:polyhydroxyalkanoate synthesis regulator phasin